MGTMRWAPDILTGYEAADLGAPSAAPAAGPDGALARTLVRRIAVPESPRAVALIVHGYNDYFFAAHLADALTGSGCAAYAVDMRRAGRSLRPGNQPHHIADIDELGDDIADAAAAARDDAAARGLGELPLIVHAHSTGALAAHVWAGDRPHPALAGLVLDGPFYGLALPASRRALLASMPAVARVLPRLVVDPARSPYTAGLLARGWTFDTAWKDPAGVGATAGWLAATSAAQRRAARGLPIGVPVLVASSDSSGPDRPDNPRLGSQDTVVEVTAIEPVVAGLGMRARRLVVAGAVHDLALSAQVPRARYLAAVESFIDSVLRTDRSEAPAV
ncbi:serine aminopeptidase domain-containing protein [Demequina rhizosphaerae]|uniref:serine aminopeptidase domain-containing protein n=1 Tax=Demequina rhizosphaerae TaxID=1638985 RepID=UPI000785D9D1|nr:alpha/beta hydrolase [Demequina rhizosphaerae]